MPISLLNAKLEFKKNLCEFTKTLNGHVHVMTEDQQWTIKGFIDVFRNVYTISADTKILSKILEIHLFPVLLKFAHNYGYRIKDILSGNGVFKNLGEAWFDEYWMNYGNITIKLDNGQQKKLSKLRELLEFKGKDSNLANPCIRPSRKGRRSQNV
jgi:hypothetical protein